MKDFLVGAPTTAIDDVLASHDIRSVFQPIVRLDGGEVVAYEALTRGPRGSSFERPDALFAAARARGLTARLDLECQATAVRTASAVGIGAPLQLFVNVEPFSFGGHPDHLGPLAVGDLDIVAEITERSLATDPAAVLRGVAEARRRGYGVAIDDVGSEQASLALMPLIDPDVIKLDMRLVHRFDDATVHVISRAVMAQAERSGALVLAEGIETAEHLEHARALGADLGQGWLFGRPAEDVPVSPCVHPLPSPRRGSAPSDTPVAALPLGALTRIAAKRHLMPVSHTLEAAATETGPPLILASAFQHARHFTPGTAERYRRLADGCSLTAVVGAGLSSRPIPGVRGADIPDGHGLEGQWVVALIGPFEAAALVARDLGDGGPDPDRRFAYRVTHDRGLVIEVVRSLLCHLEPEALGHPGPLIA